MELADWQTVRFFDKNQNIGAVPVLTKKTSIKILRRGLKIEARGNENLTINLLWPYIQQAKGEQLQSWLNMV